MQNKKIEIDIVTPRNFHRKLPHRETSDLFTPMLEKARLSGGFTVKCTKPVRGDASKANTVRFRWVPVSQSSSIKHIQLMYQLGRPDTCMLGALTSTEPGMTPYKLFRRLRDAFPDGEFSLAESLAEPAPPREMSLDDPFSGVLISRVCDAAAEDENAFIRRREIEDMGREVYGDGVNWGPEGLTSQMLKLGLVDVYDTDGEVNHDDQRFYVERRAFEMLDREHPDQTRRAGSPEDPAQTEPSATKVGLLDHIRDAKEKWLELEKASRSFTEAQIEIESLTLDLEKRNAEVEGLRKQIAITECSLQRLRDDAAQCLRVINDPVRMEAAQVMAELRLLAADMDSGERVTAEPPPEDA